MSLIKSIREQLGLSVTPANNFTLDASADNGTMKLARGNAGATTQDIMTVDAAGKVAFPQNAPIWNDVSGARATGIQYTNNYNIPIQVSVCYTTNAANQVIVGYVNAMPVSRFGDSTAIAGTFTVTFTVPVGATYKVDTNAPTRQFWMELSQ